MSTIEVVVRIDNVHTEELQAPAPVLTVHDVKGQDSINRVHTNACFNDECVICLDDIKTLQDEGHDVVVFQCLHQLCRKCAVEYLQTQLVSGADITCPTCRSVLLESCSSQYQTHRRNYYINNNHVQTNDNLPIHTQIQIQRERRLHRRNTGPVVQSPSLTFKRLILSTPCLMMLILIITMVSLYQSGAIH